MAGIINSIRNRAWLVVSFILFALLLFIVSSVDFNAFFMGDRTSIGEIAGERVEYTAFNNTYTSLMARQGDQTNANVRDQVLQQAWEQQINETLLGQEMEALGLTVTTGESTRLILGPDPSPIMLQIPDFRNPDGSFAPERVQEAISQGRSNTQLNAQLRQLQLDINANRRQEKYFQLLQQAIFVSEAEARHLLAEQRNQATFRYLAVNYAAIPDTAVELTDSDFQAYYNEHKERFRLREPEAVIQYVTFPKEATAEDSAAVRQQIAQLQPEFVSTTEDSIFAAQNSDVSGPVRYLNLLVLPDSLRGRVASARAGTVLGPLTESNQIRLIKVLDQRVDTLPDARVRIILLQRNAALADSLANVATLDNFGTLAIQYSEDPQSRFSGGDIGLFPYGALGEEADRLVRNARPGVIRTPIRTPQGTLVLAVSEKNDREVRLATITKEFVASPTTITNLERRAREFAALAQQAGLDSAAQQMDVAVRTSVPLTPATTNVPGLEQGRGLVQWALIDDTEPGDLTEVRDLGNTLVVARLESRSNETYRPLAAVREEIRPQVLNQKKAERIRKQLGEVQGQDLNALQGRVTGSFVSEAQNIAQNLQSLPGIGADPAVLGTVFGLPLNQNSKPIEGRTGVYVVNVTNRTVADSTITAEEVAALRERLQAQRRNQLISRLVQGLREWADIKDYRYRYSF